MYVCAIDHPYVSDLTRARKLSTDSGTKSPNSPMHTRPSGMPSSPEQISDRFPSVGLRIRPAHSCDKPGPRQSTHMIYDL